MKKDIHKANIEKFAAMREPLNLQDAIKEAGRCLLCKDAPCSEACPAKTDPGKFIRQIRFENFKGAARTIRNNNPLGSICAEVCPHEKLCEQNCSVRALEDPINIGGLQRFAVEYGVNHHIEPLEQGAKNKGKVAVIGAGPAGIGCASKLAKLGYEVTIFEKSATVGGITTWGIPTYRLPNKLLEIDLKNLTDLGVQIKFNHEIKTKDEIETMLASEYKAVFIGIGFAEPYRLPFLQGLTNVLSFNKFLTAVKTNKNAVDLKNKIVAVIGGGSVALDVASSAAALGAKKVYVIFLESLAESPAGKEEIKIAHKMNVNLRPSSQVIDIIKSPTLPTQLVGLKGIEVEWLKPNNFSPQNARQIAGTEFNLNVDLVVEAVGAKPGHLVNEFATTTEGKLLKIAADFSTNQPGVFAGGDVVVNGGDSVVQAVADGKKAATSIDQYIQGENAK
ncbi:MAG: FAD-dependent oxidoreductase [Gammaproteobacteria bacterium]|jgi:dihydropyrimidine dehydrogenase (NAD+) subunit PreT